MTNTFFDYLISWQGCRLFHKGKLISKAAAYWGMKAGRITSKNLNVIDKPGWENGELVNYPKYSVWLSKECKY